MQRVDETRVRYLASFFASRGMPASDARVHADIAVAIVAGAQALDRIVDRRKVDAMLREHGRWIRDAIDRGSGAPTTRRKRAASGDGAAERR